MPLTKIQSLGITDGTIVNADINASAAIASTKLSGVTSDFVKISTTTVSGTVSQIDIDFDTTTYKQYLIYWEGIQGTADFNMYGRFKVSGSYDTASNYSSQTIKVFPTGVDTGTYGGNNQAQLYFSHNVGADTYENWGCIMDIMLGSGTGMPMIRFTSSYKDNGSGYVSNFGSVFYQNFNTIEGFRLYPSTGSFDAGKYTIYGIK
jgi:hypothetical protein